jgi:hypothetical protein
LSVLESAYTVFGLHLRANRSIPGLERARTSPNTPDVEVHLGVSPPLEAEIFAIPEALSFVSSILLESGEPALRIWKIAGGAWLRLEYADGMRFWLDREGRSVWALWPDSLSLEDAATYLLGPVLGLLLRLRGVTCLHASAVVVGDRAVAFVGEEGAGKSTTAAALARRGHAVLADDIVALVEREGVFHAMPAYPYLSLWPESVEMLYGSEKTLPSFSANFEKRMLPLAGDHARFEDESLPLGAIFLLGDRSAEPAAPFLEALTPQESLLSLVANSYATRLLNEDMRAREFALLGRLVSVVPVRRLRPHEDPARIDLLCDRILAACRNPHALSLLASRSA